MHDSFGACSSKPQLNYCTLCSADNLNRPLDDAAANKVRSYTRGYAHRRRIQHCIQHPLLPLSLSSHTHTRRTMTTGEATLLPCISATGEDL
jgi:hypothetical protein